MNDIVLSGLLNLFALLGTRSGSRKDDSMALIDNYLGGHFGIKNKQTYLDLFDDFYSLYEDDLIDKEEVVMSICSNMKGQVAASELKLLQLRLMEFCARTGKNFNTSDPLFKAIAQQFGVSDALYADFADFVQGNESDNVKVQQFEGYDGAIRTLWMPDESKMLFTYLGQDEVRFNDVPVVPGVFQVWQESCVMKTRKGAPIYFSAVKQIYENDATDEVEFCGRNIEFRYPNSDSGLHNFSFDLHSGELVAIMGGSGAGKTTLLSLINGTFKPQSGSITINGHDISEQKAKDLIGYVPQDDLLVEELTVYQNLYYTAKLCFDGMSEEEIDRRVMNVLRNLGLDNAKDLKAGSPMNKTISGGQRKRLNIALELIREPRVLMLDEPTSGLSSADSEHVVGLLKEQTYKGCLVIVNIHQPSSDVYKLFDHLWLLDKGGYPVFDGNPIEAITYFKQQANYADAETSACPTCGNVNPEIVLNIIDEKALDSSGAMTLERKTSPQEWNKLYVDAQETREEPQQKDIPTSDQEKPGMLKQFWIQLRRTIQTKITNKQYLLITLLEAPILALICTWLTKTAPAEGYTLLNNKNFVSFLFMAVIVSTFIGMSGSAEEIFRDRALLKREKFLNLSYGCYISAKIVFSIIVSLIQTLLFVLVAQCMLEFHDLTLKWWIVLFMASFVANLTGLLLSQCLNSVVAIYITIPLLLIPQILLCGVVVDFKDLNGKSTTGNVPLVGDLIPSRWAYEALAVTTYTDNAFERPIFDARAANYRNQFYKNAYLSEAETQLETWKDEQARGKEAKEDHRDIISKTLPTLAAYCDIEPYAGKFDYASLKAYLDKVKTALSKDGNAKALELDEIICDRIEEIGKDAYHDLRNTHTNKYLEHVLSNEGTDELYRIVDGKVVPSAGEIYLEPATHDGRAPFYSAYKQIGSLKIKTLWFNMAVMLLMAAIVALMLYNDWPGHRLRKE